LYKTPMLIPCKRIPPGCGSLGFLELIGGKRKKRSAGKKEMSDHNIPVVLVSRSTLTKVVA